MVPPPDETQGLLNAWYEGDEIALEKLLAANLGWMQERVRRDLGQEVRRHDESMDLVQDAVMRLLKFGPRYAPENQSQFRALLARILQTTLRDRVRYLRADRRGEHVVQMPSRNSQVQADHTGERPDAIAEDRERREWMNIALDCLDPVDRRVIIMRNHEGCSFEEIAETLDFNGASGARMRYNRALPKLAEKARQLHDAVSGESLG